MGMSSSMLFSRANIIFLATFSSVFSRKASCKSYDCPCETSTILKQIKEYSKLQSVGQIPDPKILCRDEKLISVSWEYVEQPLLYLVEARNKLSNWIFINKTICHSITVHNLKPYTEYQIRLWGIADNGNIYGPSNTTWIKTHPIYYTPLPVQQINLTKLLISDYSYTAILEWEPSTDYACYYHFLFTWEEDGLNLKQREITDIDDLFQIEVGNIPFATNFSVAVMSKSMDMTRESSQKWLSFITPTCLDVYNNLTQCAPLEPENLQVDEKLVTNSVDSGTPTYDVIVNWTKPTLAPDYYTAFILFNSTNVFQNISGNESSAYFKDLPLGVRYSVVIKAYSIGGESPVALIMDKVLKVNIVVENYLIVIISVAIGILALIAILVGTYYALKKFKKSHNVVANHITNGSKKDSKDKYFSSFTSTPNNRYYKPEIAKDKWCMNSEKLRVDIMLGEGAFGVVFKGFLQNGEECETPVAIKMVKETSSMEEIRQFEQEIEIMKSVGSHSHLVSMLGCCVKTGYFGPLLIVEYCSKGDLQTYLRNVWNQISAKSTESTYIENENVQQTDNNVSNKMYELFEDSLLESKDLLSFGRQIAVGMVWLDYIIRKLARLSIVITMEYLSNVRVVHRDLAARNVLMCGNRNLKIADFGLSRDVYEDNIYLRTGTGKLPVKWMAIESLTHQHYTTQSDVWSFGIILWEIVTLGGHPYAAINANELVEYLKSGYRMECPENCSKDLYNLMLLCWRENARERPTFSELRYMLEQFLENENQYINLDVRL